MDRDTITTVIQRPAIASFRVPTIIIKNGSIKSLSPDALRLYVVISYRTYKVRSPQVQFKFIELFREIGMWEKEVTAAAVELRTAGLSSFQQNETTILFDLLQPVLNQD
jgi:hypothetical protein